MTRPSIKNLLQNMAAHEARARETTFLAPCVRGGRVRTRIGGIVQTFAPRPRDFEGWGVFRVRDERTADVIEEADMPLIEAYCKPLLSLRLHLVHLLHDRTWLAYPVNESDARQRLGVCRPLPVHLASDARPFEQITARGEGAVWWFEDLDRRADPAITEHLRNALMQVQPPGILRFPSLTPEMRVTYDLALQNDTAFNAVMADRHDPDAPNVKLFQDRLGQRQDEKRLNQALDTAGGSLREFHDRGEFWQVEWTTRDGNMHRSAISKRDLTVISSGICLSGEDDKFDLQSLVGVIEKRAPGYWDDE